MCVSGNMFTLVTFVEYIHDLATELSSKSKENHCTIAAVQGREGVPHEAINTAHSCTDTLDNSSQQPQMNYLRGPTTPLEKKIKPDSRGGWLSRVLCA